MPVEKTLLPLLITAAVQERAWLGVQERLHAGRMPTGHFSFFFMHAGRMHDCRSASLFFSSFLYSIFFSLSFIIIFFNICTTFFITCLQHFFNRYTSNFLTNLQHTVHHYLKLDVCWVQECLPSAFYRALGKIIALGKTGKKHLAKFDTQQIRKKTLGKS